MKLNVDVSELFLAAAKIKGLDAYLAELREQKLPYKEALKLAKQYVLDNEGRVIQLSDGETKLILGNDQAICFQLYEDINLFYFEC